jgi:hypothetical protein
MWLRRSRRAAFRLKSSEKQSKVIADAGVELSAEQRHELAFRLALANIRLLRHAGKERVGDLLGKPRTELSGVPAAGAGARPAAGVSLADAISAFKREHSRSWSEQYEQAVGTYLDRFKEAIGGAAVDVGYASKRGLVEFREKLRDQGLSEVTVGKHMTAVDRLMKFCMQSDWIDRNPAENLPGGFAAKDTRAPDEKRERVQDEDLKKMLGSRAFAAMRGSDDELDRERYWALMILVYTGA